MKKLIVLALVACFAASAFAGVGINWNSQQPGIFWNGAEGKSAKTEEADLALNHSDLLWQLIYAGADGEANDIDLENGSKGYVSGDDVVWAERTIYQNTDGKAYNEQLTKEASDGTKWLVSGRNAGGATSYIDLSWNTAGSVYMRVFGGTPGEGTYYLQTALAALDLSYASTTTPTTLYPINEKGTGAILNLQIPGGTTEVPEPATMGLLGLGALAMVIRRKLSK